MPRVTYNQTNFTAGELSPRLYGRVDIARYQNGAETIKNMVPLIHGGVKSRDGLQYVASTKDSSKRSRVVRYVFNRDQAYILEFGDYYIRFFNSGGQILDENGDPYEIASPYAEADLFELNFTQSADTLFIAHRDTPISRLRRFDHAAWVLDESPFVSTPTYETGFVPETAMTVSPLDVGADTVMTADYGVFIGSDVGRTVQCSNGGSVQITRIIDNNVAQGVVLSAFSSGEIKQGDWVITGSPQVGITPSGKEPAGTSITLTASGSASTGASVAVANLYCKPNLALLSLEGIEYANAYGWWTSSGANRTVIVYLCVETSAPHGLVSGDKFLMTGCVSADGFRELNGAYTVRTRLTDTTFSCSFFLTEDQMEMAVAGVVTYGNIAKTSKGASGVEAWRTEDVGSVVAINGGQARITGYQNPFVVDAVIIQPLTSTVKAIKNSWALKAPAWNIRDGYPGAATIYEQRLVAAGSHAYPNSVWFSKIGEYLNFDGGVADDDAISINVSSNEVVDIRHLSQTKALIALASGGEYTFFGGVEKPITPTNIQIKNQSVYGCSNVAPQRIGNELFFLQRARRKVRAMSYKFESDAFGAPDLSVLAEHMTEGGIVDMAYQPEPDSVLWLVRADGVLVSCTIDRDQDVIAWATHETDGAVESVACIPGASSDVVWCVVRRTINGQTKRYIERMASGLCMDSGITGTADPATDTWTGLGHLEGETVQVVGDGVVMNPQVVSGGQITVDRAVTTISVGLPFTPKAVSLTPELPSQTGSSQGNAMRTSEVTIRVLNTVGARVNGQDVAFRSLGGPTDDPVDPYTGDKRIFTLGWERGTNRVTIEQPQPLPMHILSIIRKFTVND